MAKMIRKQIYLEPSQEENLKQLARETGVSEAELIRLAIDRQLWREPLLKPNQKTWYEEQAFIRRLFSRAGGG